MATDTETDEAGVDPDAETAAEEKETSGGHSKAKLLKVGGLLLIVIVLQIGISYWLLAPSGQPEEIPNEFPQESENATSEVSIDNFSVTNNIAEPGATIHVTFNLVGLVEQGSAADFESMVKEQNKARVKQAVIEVVRKSSLSDLNDPQLGTMKRMMKEAINKVLKKSYVVEIVISEYRTLTQ
ncbi:flagellar basal body-associated FliL family protein [uncultured Gimesia sp.]|mgnify:CR=1 FL=1|uniref:flagellar basal body-associated FliL family protein n=1 Tax=uncultured Gimesia sp. TaxID=1678688 RepID=UPI0030DCDCC9